MHLQDPPDALLAILRGVEQVRAAVEHARVHPKVGQPSDVGVGHDLERERSEGVRVVRLPLDPVVLLEGKMALHGRNVDRARQEIDDRIQEQLDALVLERGAAQDRNPETAERRRADPPLQLLDRGLLLMDELLEQGLVVVRELLEQPVTCLARGVQVLRRDLRVLPLLAHVALPVMGVHLDEVDAAVELRLAPPRELEDQGVGVQPVDHHLDGAVEVGAGSIHLVDEGDARHAVAVGLPPDGLGLRFDARDGVEHGHGAVQHAERAFDLHGEVDVSGRIDDVDPMALPLARGGGRGDRDPALALLRHPVHHGGPLVDLADLVGAPRVVEDPLRGGGLARVDVGHDPDVARASERILADRESLPTLLDVLLGRRHVRYLRGVRRHQRAPCSAETRPGRRAVRFSSITSGSGRTPCWPRPSCACPRAASPRRRPRWRHP